MSNWIFRANPSQFRIHDFIHEYKFVEYLQKKNVQVGDIVYLYITAPAKRVEYKMVVEKTNISSRDAFNDTPYSLIHKATTSKDSDKVVRFKLISERVKNDDLCYKNSVSMVFIIPCKTIGSCQMKQQHILIVILNRTNNV